MNQKLLRLFCAGIVAALLLLSLPSCGQVDPMADSGIESVTVDEKGNVNVHAVIAADVLEWTEATSVHLYELLPGESSTLGKTPIASADVEHRITFSVPLKEGEATRLFSSFAVELDDGTEISLRPAFIENPELLAANRTPFLWKESPKALKVTDAAHAFEKGAMHVMLEISLSELIGADGGFHAAALVNCDRQIREATRSGQQVSLMLRPDVLLSPASLASLLSGLTAHYNGGEYGCVSALFLNMGSGYGDATVCRIANLALRSQVANGRVYMVSSGRTVDEIKAEYTNLYRVLEESGDLQWGAALVPDDSEAAWEKGEDGVFTPDKLKQVSDFLMISDSMAHADWLAVCGADYRTLDADRQAASFAYLYRVAVESGAGLVFWDKQFDDDCGLYDVEGEARPIAPVFESVDRGLGDPELALCKSLVGDAWDRLRGSFTSRTAVSGIANLGTAGLEEEVLFDFSDGDTHGFFAFSSPADAKTQHSAAFSQPVLYSWVDPDGAAKSGVRRFFDRAESLKDVTTLSVRLLTQAPDVQECRIVLSLEGQREGGERISYTGKITLANNSWKTVTFQIAAFTTGLDAEAPCVLSLTAEPCADGNEDAAKTPFVLWVRDLYVRYPSSGIENLVPIIIVPTVALLMFAVIFLVYRRTIPAHPRKRAAEGKRRTKESTAR